MEQGWTGSLCVLLGLAIHGAYLSELLNTQFSVARDVIVHMRRLRFGLSMMITLVMLIVSCCTAQESSLFRLVPIESCAIMSIDWSAIQDDGELKRVIRGDQF